MNMFQIFSTKAGRPLLAFAILILPALQVIAEGQQKTVVDKQLVAKNVFVYKPPLRGAPGARVSAGTRGEDQNSPSLYVLTPDHAGLTINAQPDLYWYVSEPVNARYQISIIEDATLKTVLESKPTRITRAGIQKIPLNEHGINLQRGVEYQWFVSIIEDNKQRSADIVASGIIERVEVESLLANRLAAGKLENGKMGNVDKAIILAEESIWYDALASISASIDLKPRNMKLRNMRATLMQQVGLQEVADYDRKILN